MRLHAYLRYTVQRLAAKQSTAAYPVSILAGVILVPYLLVHCPQHPGSQRCQARAQTCLWMVGRTGGKNQDREEETPRAPHQGRQMIIQNAVL